MKIKLHIPDQRPDHETCPLAAVDPRAVGVGARLLRYPTDQTFFNFIDFFSEN